MDWNQPISQYCERTDPSLLSEPLNLCSNVMFIVAAGLLHSKYRQQTLAASSKFLIAMIFIIGIGSAMFHSIATRWSQMADVIPIGTFLVSYLAFFLKNRVGLNAALVASGLATFVSITGLAIFVADPIKSNGSQPYFGAWITLLGITCYCAGANQNARSRWLMPTATLSLTLSLFFRTMDEQWCVIWPYGTHFLWHTGNAVVLYLVTRNYVETAANDRQERPHGL